MAVAARAAAEVKFPRTSHLFDLGRATRDDLRIDQSDAETLLRPNPKLKLSAEEKVDGANMGIFWQADRSSTSDGVLLAKNRSKLLRLDDIVEPQFKQLPQWLGSHALRLRRLLGSPGRRVLYGEWMALKHCIHYTRLPDYFLAFDIFDLQQQRFLSRHAFERELEAANGSDCDGHHETPIFAVPQLQLPRDLSRESLAKLCTETQSQLCEGPIEGIYLRWDEGEWMQQRAKMVNPEFQQSIEEAGHWTKATPVKNRVDFTKQWS